MRTVILRLSDPSGDGELHGRLEVVGDDLAVPFTHGDHLLDQLHAVVGTPRDQRAAAATTRDRRATEGR